MFLKVQSVFSLCISAACCDDNEDERKQELRESATSFHSELVF